MSPMNIFRRDPNRVFVDLDVLAVGPVAQEVSRDFDRYWTGESSFPVERILPPLNPGQVTEQVVSGILPRALESRQRGFDFRARGFELLRQLERRAE